MNNKYVLLLLLGFYNHPIGVPQPTDIELTEIPTSHRHSQSPRNSPRNPGERRTIIRIIIDKTKDRREACIAAGGTIGAAIVGGIVALIIALL